jgi:hypothetical protein
MIDFTSKQLSYIVLSLAGIGGGGYLTINQKVDDIDKKLAVAINSSDNTIKMMDKIEKQLVRIEDKLDRRQTSR